MTFKCGECDYQTERKFNLQRHAQKHDRKPREPKVYQCEQCSYKSKYKSNLNKHVKTHDRVKTKTEFVCPCCIDYKTANKSNFNKHMAAQHSREKCLVRLSEARGYIRTHKTRALQSKNEVVRVDSKAIWDREEIVKRNIQKHLRVQNEPKPRTQICRGVQQKGCLETKIIKSFIDKINTSYEDLDMKLLPKHVSNTSAEEGITFYLEGFTIDDEVIDSVVFTPEEGYGHNVSFMQSVDLDGMLVNQEYDTCFVY